MKGIFVTGTDTGVGKTVVSATLCRILRQRGIDAVALKPFATGIGPDMDWRENDPLILSAAMDYAESPEIISPLRLSQPLSPYDAARLSGATLDIDAIVAAIDQVAERHEFAIVEGVGGVRVPITEFVAVADFAQQLGLPALVVARSRVGTINHTLMTVNALRNSGVHPEGLVFMRPETGALTLDEKAGPETACRLAKVACFGLINKSDELTSARNADEFAQALPVADQALQSMAEHLLATAL